MVSSSIFRQLKKTYWIIVIISILGCQRSKPIELVNAQPIDIATTESMPSGVSTLTLSLSTPTVKSPLATITATIEKTPTATLPASFSTWQSTLTPTTIPITTFLFTGVIVPGRCVQASIDATGNPDYPYEKVKDQISSVDLAVGTLNASISDQTEHTGCDWGYQMVGSASNADALGRAGFDVISVASNHIKDCGAQKSWCDDVFLDTLNNLERVGIQPVGGGSNLQQALEPVIVEINDTRFAFVSLGDIKMDESVFARADHPGIARLTQENISAAISVARKEAEVVIALPHWGPESVAVPNWIQRNQARQIVSAGADLIVGNHTHVVQGIQEIDGVPVFYGLGNFIFDQWYPDHRQGVMLLVRFQGSHLIGYDLIPTHVDQDGQVRLADPQESVEILKRIEEASKKIR